MTKNKFKIRTDLLTSKLELGNILMPLLFLLTLQTSCKKMLEIPPPSGAIAENSVYSIDATAIEVLTGMYKSMSSSSGIFTGNRSMTLFSGLSADELTVYSGAGIQSYTGYYQNALSTTIPEGGYESWTPLYNHIFRCNAAIEGLTSSYAVGLTPSIRNQLLGEAKFMRAFCYFYLVNLFGDVPLAISTDPQTNTLLPRSSKIKVYELIIADLKDAEEKLSTNYLNETLLSTTVERVRPTKWAATALLARAYLYNSEWANAEERASALISNTSLFGTLPLNNVFLKNSKEAIWQIQPTDFNFNTAEGRILIIPATGPSVNNPVYMSKQLLNSFESGDQRKIFGNWVDTTIYKISNSPLVWDTVAYAYKYKINVSAGVNTAGGMNEYLMVLRLGEQFLIRAEARAKLNNISGAQQDLNVIRNRAGLSNTTASDQSSLLTAILKERQVELFSEWGHRWLDLKRTGSIDAVMTIVTPLKANGASWKSYQQLYPLPSLELQRASNLTQNVGY